MAVGGGGVSICLPSTSPAPAVEPLLMAPRTGRRRGTTIMCSCVGGGARTTETRPGGRGLADEHYRTLRLTPAASKGEVKKAFRHLALQYHPDVRKDGDGGLDFQRIAAAYEVVISSMAEAEQRLEYWRLRYGLADEDLDKYRYYLNADDDDWFD